MTECTPNCTADRFDVPIPERWWDPDCPVCGHCASWKNIETRYNHGRNSTAKEDCKGCTINPNDIVFFSEFCPVHHSLSDGISMADIQAAGGRMAYLRNQARMNPTGPNEQKWLDMIDREQKRMNENLRADAEWLRVEIHEK